MSGKKKKKWFLFSSSAIDRWTGVHDKVLSPNNTIHAQMSTFSCRNGDVPIRRQIVGGDNQTGVRLLRKVEEDFHHKRTFDTRFSTAVNLGPPHFDDCF